MSRVTKLTKLHRRSPRRWHPPRKRVTHVRGRTVVFGPGRISINGVEVGTVTDVSFDFGRSLHAVPMEFVRRDAP